MNYPGAQQRCGNTTTPDHGIDGGDNSEFEKVKNVTLNHSTIFSDNEQKGSVGNLTKSCTIITLKMLIVNLLYYRKKVRGKVKNYLQSYIKTCYNERADQLLIQVV